MAQAASLSHDPHRYGATRSRLQWLRPRVYHTTHSVTALHGAVCSGSGRESITRPTPLRRYTEPSAVAQAASLSHDPHRYGATRSRLQWLRPRVYNTTHTVTALHGAVCSGSGRESITRPTPLRRYTEPSAVAQAASLSHDPHRYGVTRRGVYLDM